MCVLCKTAKGRQRMKNIYKKTLGIFIIQEEKQEITISHNMLNSLNDTIAHTAVCGWRRRRRRKKSAVATATAAANGVGCICYLCLVSNAKSHCCRPTNRNPILNMATISAQKQPTKWWWWWWSARSRLHLKQIRFRGGCWIAIVTICFEMHLMA